MKPFSLKSILYSLCMIYSILLSAASDDPTDSLSVISAQNILDRIRHEDAAMFLRDAKRSLRLQEHDAKINTAVERIMLATYHTRAVQDVNAFRSKQRNTFATPAQIRTDLIQELRKGIKHSGCDENTILTFASQSPQHAQAAIFSDVVHAISCGIRHGVGSSFLTLARYGKIPCDTKIATELLESEYDREKIPQAYRKPFDGADEFGKWKGF